MARGPAAISWLTTALPAPARGGSSTRASKLRGVLAQHAFHPALHDLHLRCAVQVLPGIPAGAGGAFDGQHGTGDAHGVGQRRP